MLPVLPRELVEGHHSFPITFEGLSGGLVSAFTAPGNEPRLDPLCLLTGLGIGDVAQDQLGLHVFPLWQLAEHIDDLVVPAALLSRLWVDVAQSTPATVLFVKDLYEQCTGLHVWRSPLSTMFEHAVEDDQQLTHTGSESDLCGLARGS